MAALVGTLSPLFSAQNCRREVISERSTPVVPFACRGSCAHSSSDMSLVANVMPEPWLVPDASFRESLLAVLGELVSLLPLALLLLLLWVVDTPASTSIT